MILSDKNQWIAPYGDDLEEDCEAVGRASEIAHSAIEASIVGPRIETVS